MRYLTRRAGASLAALIAASAAQAEAPAVMTETPVTHALVSQVMGALGTPGLLLDRGGDPHHFQLRPTQARALARADLVVWIGPDLTPWLARTAETLANARVLELLGVPGTHLQPYAEASLLGGGEAHHGHDDHDHDHGHDDHGDEHEDHGHDHHDHGHGHDHAHGADDPHAWLDPGNASLWLSAIAAELSALDPANAATYQANAQAGQAQVAALAEELEDLYAPVRETGIVVYHDAYGYLAERFGLNILGSVTLGDAAAPGAARISRIRANLVQAGAECIFPEANHPDAYVALVTEDSALRVGRPLDPAGMMLDPGSGLYEVLMREMAAAIADCAAG